jgi:leucyl aminopeptidase
VLPSIRVVRGRVATSAQVKAPHAAVLALGVGAGPDGLEPGPGSADAAVRYGIDFAATAERAGFRGKAGEALVLESPELHAKASPWSGLAPAVILIGTGAGTAEDHRKAGAKLARTARGKGSVATGFGSESPKATGALVEGYLLGAYRPVRYGRAAASQSGPAFPVARALASLAQPGRAQTGRNQPGRAQAAQADDAVIPPEGPTPDANANVTGDLTLIGGHDRQAVDRARLVAAATTLARDLVNWPSNLKTPATFASQAVAAAASRDTLRIKVLGPDELASQGLNATLAVGAAAWQGPAADPSRAPRLVVATHTPPNVKGAPRIVIVGKGITFDSGGLDLKPNSGLVTMKTDMAGGATAVAAVLAAADLGLPAQVTAVVPLAQNSVGAGSYRPGDVIGIGGKTQDGGAQVEVGDTDAEGRLVLADALAYARANLKPDCLIDVATLTGAAKVALGLNLGAVMTRDDTLAAWIEEAGLQHGERWWRLPLAEDYREALETPNADLNSIGAPGWGAGAITAGLFLERFAGAVRWAHLDIAGPARAGGGQDWTPPGATGFGVRTLVALVERLA